MSELQVDLDAAPDEALEILATVAEGWGAEWQADGWGGRLTLPARAGLRVGLIEARVAIDPHGNGCAVRIEPETERWAVHWQAVVILLFGAFGAVAAIAWPFHPTLLRLAPLGIGLSLAAWFLVASRLRSSGPEEFLAALAAAARHG